VKRTSVQMSFNSVVLCDKSKMLQFSMTDTFNNYVFSVNIHMTKIWAPQPLQFLYMDFLHNDVIFHKEQSSPFQRIQGYACASASCHEDV
jgi:hypothetical protein